MGDRFVLIGGTRRGPGGMALETDVGSAAEWEVSGAVTCKACHYANRVSRAFFALSVQHLYCRCCGKMIDRNGKPAVAS